jgi:hypothetical protein
VDLVTRMQKRAADALEPGESYVAALRVVPPGATSKSANPFGAFGAVGAFASAAAEARSDETTWVEVPIKGLILGLTDRRLLIFGQSLMGIPTELVASAPRSSVHVEIEAGKAGPLGKTRTYRISTNDGNHVAVEANTSGPAAKRADAFEAVLKSPAS